MKLVTCKPIDHIGLTKGVSCGLACVAFVLRKNNKTTGELIDHGGNTGARAVDVIDDQHGVMGAQVFKQVLHAMYADGLSLADHLRVARGTRVRCANRNMVGFDAEMLEALLYGDTDSTAATPQADKKIGLESCLIDIRGELKRVTQEIVRGDESLFHCLSVPLLR